jgi:hypothetical protein
VTNFHTLRCGQVKLVGLIQFSVFWIGKGNCKIQLNVIKYVIGKRYRKIPYLISQSGRSFVFCNKNVCYCGFRHVNYVWCNIRDPKRHNFCNHLRKNSSCKVCSCVCFLPPRKTFHSPSSSCSFVNHHGIESQIYISRDTRMILKKIPKQNSHNFRISVSSQQFKTLY